MPDVPQWWIERAFIAIEGENEVRKKKQGQGQGQGNAQVAEMHGGQ